MQIKNLGQENGFWFQVNLETNPPILFVSNPDTQKQDFIFGKLGKNQKFCFNLIKFIEGTIIEINKQKAVYWIKNGKLHREDGPAFVWADGTKCWYKNDKLYRKNGPARVWADGSKEWWKNGDRHREDGPAIIHPDGNKEWWINNIKYSEQTWRKLVKAKQNAD